MKIIVLRNHTVLITSKLFISSVALVQSLLGKQLKDNVCQKSVSFLVNLKCS